MTLVIKQKILNSRIQDFNEKANKLIEDGWQPIGGVTVDQFNYVQTFVRYKSKNEGNEK